MRGMSRITGKPLDGAEHLEQSVGDILSTPIGTRVGRREYGSLMPLLMDQPMNAVGRARLYASSAMAIARWEPRIRVTGFGLTATVDGKAALTITGERLDVPRRSALTLIVPFSS